MLDTKRWKELRAMNDGQLSKIAHELGLEWPAPLRCISIMNAEFRRDSPDKAANLDAWFGKS